MGRKAKGMKISKKEISQTFKISDLTKKKVNKEQSQEIADALVEAMLDRTASGNDIRFNEFTKYSKDYAKKKGVSRKDVDMELKRKMLNDIKITRANTSTIKIEITKKIEKLKSFNHNMGDTLPKREHFGHLINDARKITKVVVDSESDSDG